MISLKSIDEKLTKALARAKDDDETVELEKRDVRDLLELLEVFRASRGFLRVIRWLGPFAGFVVIAVNNWQRLIDYLIKLVK